MSTPLDAVLAALVRDAVRAELAPVVAELRALAGQPAPSPWLDTEAAAQRAGCDGRTLTRAAARGELPAARVGARSWRFKAEHVDRWLADNGASARPRRARRARAHQLDQQPNAAGSPPESAGVAPVCGSPCEPVPMTLDPMNESAVRR